MLQVHKKPSLFSCATRVYIYTYIYKCLPSLTSHRSIYTDIIIISINGDVFSETETEVDIVGMGRSRRSLLHDQQIVLRVLCKRLIGSSMVDWYRLSCSEGLASHGLEERYYQFEEGCENENDQQHIRENFIETSSLVSLIMLLSLSRHIKGVL